MMRRVLIIVCAVILLLVIAGLLYVFLPPRLRAEWDTSPEVSIIKVGYVGEVDYNYIPAAQVWGDGHIIWVEYDSKGNRRVLEGSLSKDELAQLIDKLIDADFFKGYRRFDWRLLSGEYLSLRLSNVWHQVAIDPTGGYSNSAVLDLVEFLKSGAGTTGTDLIPVQGILHAYPLEQVSLPNDLEASYQWPDERFGYGLESVYLKKPHNEIPIAGEELAFAWEVVNSPSPLVESEGEVYWIGVVIPYVSF
jgi:hypothetical protein